jgi:anthranilate phosphoribosyltransferase
VVHGHDGLDEISVCAPTRVCELRDGQIRTYDLHPEQYFGEQADPAALRGGSPRDNARVTRDILSGTPGPPRDIVLLNAAAALTAAGKADGLSEGLERAAAAVDDGRALEKLEALVDYTRQNA